MASLATDQLNSVRDVLSDSLCVSGFVLWLLGLLLAADQSLSLGELFYSSPTLSQEFSFTFLHVCVIFCFRATFKAS